MLKSLMKRLARVASYATMREEDVMVNICPLYPKEDLPDLINIALIIYDDSTDNYLLVRPGSDPFQVPLIPNVDQYIAPFKVISNYIREQLGIKIRPWELREVGGYAYYSDVCPAIEQTVIYRVVISDLAKADKAFLDYDAILLTHAGQVGMYTTDLITMAAFGALVIMPWTKENKLVRSPSTYLNPSVLTPPARTLKEEIETEPTTIVTAEGDETC